MVIDTEGLVLRQIKTLNGRRMLLLFSKKFGKISVGTGITEGGKNKSALALRPFTYGRYELFKGRDVYNLNGGQAIKSYYSLGENLDKYMAASYVLELTEKVLPEGLAQPKVFGLLVDYLNSLENRNKAQDTITLAYVVKLLDAMGSMPFLDGCCVCGCETVGNLFSIQEGGMICSKCAEAIIKEQGNEPLIYDANFGIVNILKFFRKEQFSAFKKIALNDEISKKLQAILKEYMSYHLDVGRLKSEDFSIQ